MISFLIFHNLDNANAEATRLTKMSGTYWSTKRLESKQWVVTDEYHPKKSSTQPKESK
jgi:hypothetical protein